MTFPSFSVGEVLTAADMNAVGLWRVTSCTVTSVGGTAATASNGVVTIGAGNTSVTIANAFSSDYANYRIVISGATASVGSDYSFQFSGITGSVYQTAGFYMTPGTATLNAYAPAAAVQWLIGSMNTVRFSSIFDVISPQLAQQKFFMNSAGISTTGYYQFSGLCTSTTSATGFSLIPNTGNFQGGTVRVYGYRN